MRLITCHLDTCRQLSQMTSAGINLRLNNLIQWDECLVGTKPLGANTKKITILFDLSPIPWPHKDN